MNRVLKILLIVMIGSLLLGFIGYSYNLSEIQIKLVGDDSYSESEPLKYHFMLIAQDMGSAFWQSVREGALRAGEEYGAAIEFNGPVIQDEQAVLDYMEIAIASRVDGIVVYATDKEKFTPLINKAVSLGIHVITIESDDRDSDRDAFVGPNSYSAGLSAGNLVLEAAGGKANVAVIIGGNYASNADARASLLKGFDDSVLNYPNIKRVVVRDSSTGYFGAETAIRAIIDEFPDVNTVVCTSSDDTLEVVQMLIDINMESRVTVIGYDNSPQIRDYIKNNDIYGSVYEDPKDSGFISIQSLVDIIGGKRPPPFINTGVYTITRSNLVSYHGS